jgi:hypothetical protein
VIAAVLGADPAGVAAVIVGVAFERIVALDQLGIVAAVMANRPLDDRCRIALRSLS